MLGTCGNVAHINSEGNSQLTIFSGGRTSDECFAVVTQPRNMKQTQRICVSINFVLSSWNVCCLWQCEKINRIIFLSLLCLWSFERFTFAQHRSIKHICRVKLTRHVSCLWLRVTHLCRFIEMHIHSQRVSLLYIAAVVMHRKKNLDCILSRNLEYRSSHKTTFHPQRPPASCQIST